MILSASDVASAARWSAIWEFCEYGSEGLVLLGCAGEYIAEYTKWRTEDARHSLGRRSLIILILGLGTGLFSLIKTNALAGLIIVSMGEQVEQAGKKAERVSGSLGTALSIASRAESASSDALSNSQKAQTASTTAIDLAMGARHEADSFEKDIVLAKTQAASAESHLAEAHREALAAKRELDEYKAPREITVQQRAQIASRIRPFSPIRIDVLVVGGTTEIQHISDAVTEAITGGGWTIGNFGIPMGGISATGITVLTHLGSTTREEQAANALVLALQSSGLPTGRNGAQFNDDLPAAMTGRWDTSNVARIRIVIGAKQ